MENYILQILEKNNRVIVPEFGAFIVKQRNPLTIVFNEFLQYNDGMLVDFISKEEGISRDEAKEKIDAFVKEVSGTIQKGKSYSLPRLGMITKSAAGKISIEPGADTGKEKKGKTAATKVQKPATETADQKATKKEEKKEETPTQKTAEPEKKEGTKEEKKPAKETPEVPKETEEKKKETKETAEKETAKTQDIKEEVKSKTTEKKEEPKAKPEESKTLSATEKKSVTTKETETRKTETAANTYTFENPAYQPPRDRKKMNIILWIIIIVIVNGTVIGFFIFNKDLRSIFVKTDSVEVMDFGEDEMLVPEDQASTEEEATLDEVHPEEVQTQETEKAEPIPIKEPEQKAAPVKKEVSSGTRYYVVAGVFRDEQNADNLVRELKSRGYNSEKFGKIGNLHAVSYGVFDTKTAARNLLQKVQKNEDPEAWIRTVK